VSTLLVSRLWADAEVSGVCGCGTRRPKPETAPSLWVCWERTISAYGERLRVSLRLYPHALRCR